jgi:exopolysaccharide biosynthesis polyprenyl glycosylphosphotransferase
MGYTGPSFVVTPVIQFFAIAPAFGLAIRFVLIPVLLAIRESSVPSRNVLVIGSGPLALRCYESLLMSKAVCYRVSGFVDNPGSHTIPERIKPLLIAKLEELEGLLVSVDVDEVIIAMPFRSCYDDIQAVIHICGVVGVAVSYWVQPFCHPAGHFKIGELGSQFHLTHHPNRLLESNLHKRIADLLISTVILFASAPLLVLIAIAIKLDSRGPVLFLQKRYGKNKRLFTMYKFRTMIEGAERQQTALEAENEAIGPNFKIRHDPRITRVGKVLRKTSMDELPQLFNILRGDMSLVGPRPLPVRDVQRFTESWLMRRFCVKPGLTCLWQINGRSNTGFEQWIAYDLEYIDTWSPLLDLKILLLTVPAVVRGSGAM